MPTDIPTAKVHAIRVSKSGFKPWLLYGRVDQALKTSTQSESVKVINLAPITVGGSSYHLELWTNATSAVPDGSDELNPPAEIILLQSQIRQGDAGVTYTKIDAPEETMMVVSAPINSSLVKGVAIITGPGVTDVPDEDFEELVQILLGRDLS